MEIFNVLITNIIEHINKVKFHLSFLKLIVLFEMLINKEIKKKNPEINKVVDNKKVPI